MLQNTLEDRRNATIYLFIYFWSSELNNSWMDVLTSSGLDRLIHLGSGAVMEKTRLLPVGDSPHIPGTPMGRVGAPDCAGGTLLGLAQRNQRGQKAFYGGELHRGNLGRGCYAEHRGPGWICQSRSRWKRGAQLHKHQEKNWWQNRLTGKHVKKIILKNSKSENSRWWWGCGENGYF